ncbi:MAG TPA: hypothetical protein VHC19_14130 [Pirellulales bacterium]|nr:hypothetical protein [Pirellulales bacterium]
MQAAANRSTIRPFAAAFARYRPRALTLVVLFVAAALIVLANLSNEISQRRVDALTSSANLRVVGRTNLMGGRYSGVIPW